MTLNEHFPVLTAVVMASAPKHTTNLKDFIRKLERQFIEQALANTHQNRTLAAQLLGINRSTLVMKMKAQGMKLNEKS